jgi:hypothetical protein
MAQLNDGQAGWTSALGKFVTYTPTSDSIQASAALKGWPTGRLQPTSVAGEAVHASACFIAISLSFLVYGVLQERMMTVGFGAQRELFTSSLCASHTFLAAAEAH